MDKLPSRHAISEVTTWVSLMEDVIRKDEEDINNCIGYKAIHEYLQKYKVFKPVLVFSFHIPELFYLKELKDSRDGKEAVKFVFHAQ